MRVLIFTLLAVAVSAANYGYDSYYGGGGYPSYPYGGYGSSLYGAGYGYGSGAGYGYGSGSSYGLGGSGWAGGLSSYTTAYKPAVYQTARYSSRQPHGTEAVYRSGYSPAPGKIEFILGNSGYRTGTRNKPVLPKRSGIHVGVQEPVEDVSQILLHEKAGSRFGGISSQAALPKPVTGSQGFKEVGTHNLGSSGPKVSFVRETGITGSRPNIHAYDKVSAPLGAAVLAKIPSRVGGTTGTLPKSEEDPPRISFTRDFSKVSGHSEQIDTKPEIHGTDTISSPGVEAAARPESDQDVGAEHKSETHGISDTDERGETDFTGVSGLGIGEVKSPTVSFGRPTTSEVSALPRPSSESVHRSGVHGISSAEGPQITFIQGTSALHPSGIKTSSFDKISAARRPSYGSRVTEVQPNIPAPAFPAAGPSRITFTQDFSRVSGHQGARRFTSSTSAKKPAPASKQPVADQPSFTSFYEQGRTHGVPVRSDGSVAGDKSIFADSHFSNVEEQDGVKFSNFVVVPEEGVGKSSAFEHSTVGSDAGGKVSSIRHSVVGTRDHSQLVVPSYAVSSPGEAVDRSSVFVAIPVEDYGQDKSTVLLHSTGVFPVGSLVEERGSTFKFSSGEADSVLSRQGQSQGYSTTTTPFKSYHSSSYPGYSHVSGESPRFDFSPDRSLLYTYNSPHLVSPFSYSYTSDSKYYGGGSRKTIGQ